MYLMLTTWESALKNSMGEHRLMVSWLKTKLTIIIIAAVAVFTVAGAGAVMAAQNHPFSSSPRTSDGASSQQQNEFEAQGVIQQVTFDQNTTQSGNLVFLPNGEQTTVTVVFTTATHIEVEADANNAGNSQNDAGPLQAGMSAKVEGVAQADGSILAKEINANGNNGNDNNDQNDQRLFGVIQSIDQNSQTFVLLPDGQTTPVTIAFDAQTRVDEDNEGQGHHSALTNGEHVRVETVKRADGSLYANEIQPASSKDGDGDTGGNDGGNDGGQNGQPTPTPGSGGHGDGGN